METLTRGYSVGTVRVSDDSGVTSEHGSRSYGIYLLIHNKLVFIPAHKASQHQYLPKAASLVLTTSTDDQVTTQSTYLI